MKFIKDFIHFKRIGALLCRDYDRKAKNGR